MYKEIAKWLYDKIINEGDVYQSDAVREIAEKFGEEYTYPNENGNPAIDKKVLAEFGKLKGEDITWDRSNLFWHKKTDLDRQLEGMTADLPVMDDLPKMEPLPKVELPRLDDFENFDIK